MDLNDELRTARWVKSSRSGGNGGDCVEIAPLSAGRVGVRDSKNQGGPALILTLSTWDAFVGDIKTGKLDHLA
jgi:hypothetical protein